MPTASHIETEDPDAEPIEALRRHLPALARDFDVSSLGVFGSRIRGDYRDDSDLDVLVTFRRAPSLFRFVALENHLSDLLGVKVDLVMKRALKPRLAERILEQVVAV